MPRLLISPADRIRRNSIEDDNGCWIWQLRLDRHGYGQVSINGRSKLAHRAAYEQMVGPIPDGMTIDHVCRNTRCVNPAHLEPVTNRENILRSEGITARAARKTHCPKGHPYNESNTYRHGGKRDCRACALERMRAYDKRRRSRSDA